GGAGHGPTHGFWGGGGGADDQRGGARRPQRDLRGDRQAGAQPAAEEREAGVDRHTRALVGWVSAARAPALPAEANDPCVTQHVARKCWVTRGIKSRVRFAGVR